MKNNDMKNLCKSILEEEKIKNNLDTNMYCTGKLQYYIDPKSYFLKGFELYKKSPAIIINSAFLPLYSRGFHNYKDNSIVIFINNNKKLIKVDKKQTTLVLIAIYHELYHAIDEKRRNSDQNYKYDDFFSDVDENIRKIILLSDINYLTGFHDDFMFEILASKYAVERVKEFAKRNPTINCDHDLLIQLEKKYNYKYDNCNLSQHLDLIINNYKKLRKVSKVNLKIFNVFLNDDGSFKNLNDILSNQDFKLIDPKIVESFFKTKKFIGSLNLNNISLEDQFLIKQMLEDKKEEEPKELEIQNHEKFKNISDADKINKIIKVKRYSAFIIIFILSNFISRTLKLNDFSLLNNNISPLLDIMGISSLMIFINNILVNFSLKYGLKIKKDEINVLLEKLEKNLCKEKDEQNYEYRGK